MKEFVYIGKIVNTHGIKGEVRILSQFERKDFVFKKGKVLSIGNDKKEVTIKSYRVHKDFDMVTLEGFNNINDVLEYKGQKVYVKRSDLDLTDEDYLYEDLIGFKVFDEEKEIGVVKDVVDANDNILLSIEFEKHYYIPLKSDYIKKIDVINKKIMTSKGSDLIL